MPLEDSFKVSEKKQAKTKYFYFFRRQQSAGIFDSHLFQTNLEVFIFGCPAALYPLVFGTNVVNRKSRNILLPFELNVLRMSNGNIRISEGLQEQGN